VEIIVFAVLAASVVTLMVSFYLGDRILRLRRLAELVSSTPRLAAEDGGSAVAAVERVAVVGRTVAGSDGLVQAPLSGIDCVWYRVVVARQDTIGSNEGVGSFELYTTSGGTEPIPGRSASTWLGRSSCPGDSGCRCRCCSSGRSCSSSAAAW